MMAWGGSKTFSIINCNKNLRSWAANLRIDNSPLPSFALVKLWMNFSRRLNEDDNNFHVTFLSSSLSSASRLKAVGRFIRFNGVMKNVTKYKSFSSFPLPLFFCNVRWFFVCPFFKRLIQQKSLIIYLQSDRRKNIQATKKKERN